MANDFRTRGPRRRRLLLLVGALVAVLAGYWAYSLARSGTSQAPLATPATRAVVVAAHDIPERTTIVAADLKLRQLTDDASLAQAYSDPAAVVGRVTGVAVQAGQVIYPNVLVTTIAGAPFSILGPNEQPTGDSPYWRAVAVQVPAERAVGGQILAGQFVDVIVTLHVQVCVKDPSGACTDIPTSEGYLSGDSTKIAYQDLQVLQVLPDQDMYVLKVDLATAEAISHIAETAPNAFSLVLRPDGDTRIADSGSFGETNDRLILYLNLPLSKLIDLRLLVGNGVNPSPTTAPVPTATPAAAPSPTP